MALETFVTDGLAHIAAGVGIATLDFLTYRVANPKDERLNRKTRCLASIEVILDTEKSLDRTAEPSFEEAVKDEQGGAALPSDEKPEAHIVPKDSLEYAQHVANVQNYLRSTGIVKLDLPFYERMKDGVKNLIYDGKVNDLTNLQKLGVAIGVEVVGDIVIGVYQGAFPIPAVAKSLYQIPTLWVGLWLGNGLRAFLNMLTTSGEERRLNKGIEQLLKETTVVDIIIAYEPPEEIQKGLFEQGINLSATQLTRLGKGAFHHLKQFAESAGETAEGVVHYAEKKEEQAQQEKAERQKRFDKLTKGR